jgi:hypothetical protein
MDQLQTSWAAVEAVLQKRLTPSDKISLTGRYPQPAVTVGYTRPGSCLVASAFMPFFYAAFPE